MLRAFLREKRGGVIIFLGLAIIPLIGAVGLAVDSARGYLVKQRLSQAVDAAALAAGRVIGSDDLSGDIHKYFDANFPAGYAGADAAAPTFTVDEDDEMVTVAASVTMPTSFMRVLGVPEFNISATAEVRRGTEPMDIVLSIDTSGSMDDSADGGGTRIEAAQAAAITLVNKLFGTEATKSNLYIGVVPWSSMVDVTEPGSSFSSTTTSSVANFTNPVTGAVQSEIYYANNSPVPLLFQPPSDWKGCVRARYDSANSDASQGDTRYGPDTFASVDWHGWVPTGASTSSSSSSSSTKKSKKSSSPSPSDSSPCPPSGITPLRNSKSAITTAVNALDPDGVTNMAQGLVWAWRVLMPGEPFTESEPVPSPPPYRAIILLTDGQQVGGDDDAYSGAFGTGSDAADAGLDDRLRQIASNVKAQDIKIFTIQFANADSDLQSLMQEIATSPHADHYFYAPDVDTLESIFEEIANRFSTIYLAK